MKVFTRLSSYISIAVFCCIAHIGFAQVTIAGQDFDAVNSMTYSTSGTGGATATGSSAAGDRPASATFYLSSGTAYGTTNGTTVITFANVTGLGSYTGKSFTFRLASWSLNSTGNGADAGDIVTVAVSLDGGTVYSNEVRVLGNGNAYWHYSSGTGTASVTYDGNNTPTDFAPASGGARTTDGYSTVTVNLADATTQARLRITMLNNAANERWTVDDVLIRGTSSSPTVTIANTGTPASGNINNGTNDAVLTAFNLTPSASVDFTAVSIATSGTATTSDIGNFRVFYDANANSAIDGGESSVSGAGIALANPLSFTITGQTGFSSVRRYLVVADIAGGATNGQTITASISAAGDVTTTGTESGTAAGNQQTIVVPNSPALAAGAVSAGFGNVCINTQAGANPTFTITGSYLTSADISVSGNAAYTFATSSGGTYSNPLNITQGGCAAASCYSQTIYIRFTPTAVTSYNGNITVSGGGASAVTTAVTGSGVNSTPAVTTGSGSGLTTTTATAAGTINSNGCTSVTAYGIEYSTTSPIVGGTQVPSSNLSGGNFSSSISGLTANTNYYFKAYATNGGGTGNGSESTFVTYPDAPATPSGGSPTQNTFTVTWSQVSGTANEFYELRVFSDAAYSIPVGSVYTTANNATSQLVSGLSSNTQYWFQLRAVNNATQASAWVNGPGFVTTLAAPLWENPINGTDPGMTNPYTTGQTVGSANITVSGIGRGTGVNGSAGSNRYNTENWQIGSLSATKYITFTLTPNAGYEIDFTNFVYTGQTSGSGPVSFAFRTSVDGFTANVGSPSATGTTISLSAAAYQDVTSAITFRIYAWGASAAAGTFSINDFTFNGVVAAVACNAPTANATAITFGNILTSSVRVTGFTAPGGGADGYVVKMNSTNSFTDMTDGDNPTTDVSWNNAGEQVVYNGTTIPSTLDITGLTPNTQYYFKVYAYKCAGRLYNNTETTNSNPDDVTTNAVAPEIAVSHTTPSTNIADGSTFNFGSVNVGSTLDIQFTIENLGSATADLTLTTPFTAGGAYSILSQPALSTLTPGATTNFTITFTPVSGLNSYSFSFANNDSDENPFNITFEGTGVPACTTPNAVTNITLTPSSASVSGTIDAPSGGADGYLVIRNPTGTLSTTPTSGSSYTVGNAFGTGTIVAFGTSASFNAGGLNPNSTYHFFVFPYNNTGCFGGPNYNTTGYSENTTTLNLSYQPFDNFDRTPPTNTVGEPSSLPGSNWIEVESGASSVRVSTNALLLDRDGNGGSNGLEYAYFDMTGKYPTVFSSAGSMMEWYFNVRQTRPDPSGYNSGNYGCAFILGATSNDATAGNGYAVIIGNNNGAPFTADEGIHLVRYTGGLDLNSNITPVISWYTGDPFTGTLDYDNEFSIKVNYNPTNNEWNLYVRDDGTFGGGFADPTTVNNTHLRGTATNNTYTASNLNYLIPYWHRASGSGEYAMFDNISVPLATTSNPEITVAYTTNAVNIADAGSVDFGPVRVTGGSYTMSFTVTNIGTSDLTLGAISITGTNAADFTNTNPVSTTLAANASTTFTITFDPSASGARTATFSMVTNDSDENPFNFTLNGEGATPPVINEFVADHSGTDTNEFIEIFGANSTPYSNMTLLVIEGDESVSLTVEGVINNLFTVGTTSALGFWSTGFLNNQIQNGTSTMLLVMNFSGSLNQDLDTNDDGVLDVTPWTRIVDAVALRDDASDKTYGSPTVIAPNFDGVFLAPGGASRIPNGTDTDNVSDWLRNDVDGWGLTGFTGTIHANETKNTPNRSNTRFNVWLGTNTVWNNASNWTVRIPNDTTEALIPTVGSANYPVINTIATFDCFGLYLSSSSATITLGAGAEIRNHHNFQTNSGAATFGTGTISFVGNAATTISGTFTIGELAINNTNGVTIQSGAVVNVTDILTLESGQLTNSGTLNLKSSATKTAYIDDFSGSHSGTLSGNVTMERFVPPTAGSNIFHYVGALSSATAGAKWSDDFNLGVTGTNGFISVSSCTPTDPRTAPTSNYGGLFTYHESNVTTCYLTGWKVENSAYTVSPGRGVATRVSNNTILDETGAYPNPVNNVTVTNLTKTTANSSSNSRGYNLVANPFHAPLDWTGVASDNVGTWDGTAYIYNSASGTYSTSNFLTSAVTIGTNQAFFVRASNATPASASLNFVFNESRRTTGNNGVFYRRPALYNYGLRIVIDNNGNTDNTLIAFDETFTNDFDNGYDAAKLFNNVGVPSIYTKVGIDNQAILALPLITDSTRTIPLSVLVTANGVHDMVFGGMLDFPATTIVWLEDLKLGVLQNLRSDSTYSFNGNTADSADRFLLHLTPPIVITGQDATCAGNDALISAQHAGSDWVVTVSDSSGTVVATETGGGTVTLIDSLPAGAYTILLTYDTTYQVTEAITLSAVQPVNAGFTASATSTQVDSTIQFTSNSSGATNYEWDFGDSSTVVTGVANPAHTYDAPGTYTVTLRALNADCNDVTTTQVQVDKSFVITGQDATCAGNDAVISVQDADSDWTIYVQKVPGAVVAVEVGSGAVTLIDSLSSGTYTILIAHANSYQVNESITLGAVQSVSAGFTASETTTYVDSLIQFTSNSTGATNYEWDFGDNTTAVTGVANPTHAYADTGTYTVTLRALNADCDDVTTLQIVVEEKSTIGIGNVSNHNLWIAEHEGNLYIQFDFAVTEDADVTISNLLGQQIFTGKVKTEGTRKINLTETTDEQYLVVIIRTSSGVFVKKVLIPAVR